jgi:hypothetical protein
VNRQENELGPQAVCFEPPHGVEPAHPGHVDIGDDDVGPVLPRALDELLPIVDRGDDLDLVFEETAEPLRDYRVVIRDEDSWSWHLDL